LDVCLMNLSNQDMNDDDLAELLRAAPPRSMLLLEDVDAIFVERTAAAKGGRGGGVSFSGLLNALDGAAAQEGCVIMLTTNHKDRLDEALIRPGRCDMHVHVQKASQDQARRMYCRFFAREAKVKVIDVSGTITMDVIHGFKTGDPVACKGGSVEDPMEANFDLIDENTTYFVRTPGLDVPTSTQKDLLLYDTLAHAEVGGSKGLVLATGGKNTKLQSLPPSAARFGSRIPEKQISMAKLQGYLMKQKLESEQHFKALSHKGQLPPEVAAIDLADDEQRFLYNEAVVNFASEAAVMNVHELLDVKIEAEEERVSIYDYLHRLGLHRFAPIFEHFGVREKKHITTELKDRMEQWDPDLKTGSQRDRMVALIDNNETIKGQLQFADLSVLRDRFLATYQHMQDLPTNGASTLAAPPPSSMSRSTSEPSSSENRKGPTRKQMIRQSSGVDAPENQLNMLDMAHQFQEALECNGKSQVSLWQLDLHFQRFAGDPHGALQHCHALRKTDKDRSTQDQSFEWMTTFGFLSRIGLEEYAFNLEDNKFKMWVEWKHLSKDELKDKAEMPEKVAAFCHSVLQASKDRADLVRKFQLPLFADLQSFFQSRFPEAPAQDAQRFAVRLTDDAGSTHVSCLQVECYLKEAKSPAEALANLAQGLLPVAVAEAARKRPEAPPPPKECEEWVHLWLKKEGLEHQSGPFMGQALLKRDEVLGAPLDHIILTGMGINKIGERCKILKMIAAEKGTKEAPGDKDDKRKDDTPNVQEAAVEKESADKGEDKASKANSGKSGKNKK